MAEQCKQSLESIENCGKSKNSATYNKEIYYARLEDFKNNATLDADGYVTSLGNLSYFYVVQSAQEKDIKMLKESKEGGTNLNGYTTGFETIINGLEDQQRNILSIITNGLYVGILVNNSKIGQSIFVVGAEHGLMCTTEPLEGSESNATKLIFKSPETGSVELSPWSRIKTVVDTFEENMKVLLNAVVGKYDCSLQTDVTGLNASVGVTTQAVTLTWVDDVTTDKVIISYVPVGSEAQPIEVVAGVQTVTIAGLTNGTEYDFKVISQTSTGTRSCGINKKAVPTAV